MLNWENNGEYHEWASVNGFKDVCTVQTPTRYNKFYRSTIFFVKPYIAGVKDHLTLREAREWCENNFCSGLVWC